MVYHPFSSSWSCFKRFSLINYFYVLWSLNCSTRNDHIFWIFYVWSPNQSVVFSLHDLFFCIRYISDVAIAFFFLFLGTTYSHEPSYRRSKEPYRIKFVREDAHRDLLDVLVARGDSPANSIRILRSFPALTAYPPKGSAPEEEIRPSSDPLPLSHTMKLFPLLRAIKILNSSEDLHSAAGECPKEIIRL